MNEFQSLLLGIIQGLTEFLPVSSSGHLILGEIFLGVQTKASTLFTVLLHIATLLAVVIVFRKRLAAIIRSLFLFLIKKCGPADKENLRLFLILVLATLVTVLVVLGLYGLEKYTETQPKLVSLFFIVTGLILLSTLFFKGEKDYGKLKWWHGVATGLAQGIGVLPGISRSGITISSALACGIKRQQAGEYSFLLAIPAILGALALELKDVKQLAANIPLHIMGLGMAAAFIVGLLSIFVLLKIINRGKLFYFSIYLIPLGVISFFLL
jgi:undecaprenyl-diphosphatase